MDVVEAGAAVNAAVDADVPAPAGVEEAGEVSPGMGGGGGGGRSGTSSDVTTPARRFNTCSAGICRRCFLSLWLQLK